jgi:hypothetical protein
LYFRFFSVIVFFVRGPLLGETDFVFLGGMEFHPMDQTTRG